MSLDHLRVLLIDDDEDDYIIIRELLAEVNFLAVESPNKLQLDWVATYEAAREAIDQAQHDVYLVDYRLGPHDGLELIQESLAQGCMAPLILLTGQGDLAVDLEAMQAGAADYLVKGQLDAPLLERSIRYALERKRSEAQIQRRNRELALLNQVIAASAAGLALDAILQIACRELALTFNVPRGTALLLNDDRTVAVVTAQYVGDDLSSLIGLTIPLDYPSLRSVVNAKAPVFIEDVQTDQRLAPIHSLLQQRQVIHR